jgi:hypothetical protein
MQADSRFPVRRSRRAFALLAAVILLLVGCGGDSEGSHDQTSAGGSGVGAAGEGGGGQASGGATASAAGGASNGTSGGTTTDSGGTTTASGGTTTASGGTGIDDCDTLLTLCGVTCVDTQVSPEHCGACDNTCDATEICVAGECSATCDDPRTLCDDTCTDLESDAANCGACGARCGRGTPCIRGTCGCPDDSVSCLGSCIDPLSDADNCGTCGTPCAGDSICVEGRCECPPGTSVCGNSCVSLLDPEHCGGCDQSCDSGEVCSDGECLGSTDPCPEGTMRCGAACVDTDVTPTHCGGCNQICGGTQFCEDGACRCPSGKQACGTACVDTSASPVHCGDCDNVCAVGQVCEDGDCVCMGDSTTECDGVCVQTESDPNHCGACGNECGEYPCTLGECKCPAGEELCDGSCVNTESDAQHCGGCDVNCLEGDACILGQCSDEVDDGCSNTLAGGIALSEIAFYQAGKVTLMSDGDAVTDSDRPVDVITEKPGLLRAFVALDSDFSERVLSARLVVVNGDQVDALFHKRTVSVASTDASLATTFNFELSGDLIQPDTRYSLELVECESGSGSSVRPRFPSGGTAELEARSVGPLRLVFVPIIANDNSPRTDAAHLGVLTDYVRAMYPISALETSLGEPMEASRAIGVEAGWEQTLQELSDRHYSDDAPNDVYYYGLLEPESTFDDFCIDNACTLGIGYITTASLSDRHFRVSMGLSYGDTYSAETTAHELGHNLGREHAPCGGPAYPDPDFPHAGARIGWWGYQSPDVLTSPTVTRDIMSYCENPWVSDYTYQALADRTAIINGNTAMLNPYPIGHWRVVVVTPRGTLWGVPFRGEVSAAGTPEGATILDRLGDPMTQVTVYRQRMGRPGSASVMVPEPEPGWYAVQLNGEAPLAFDGSNQSAP